MAKLGLALDVPLVFVEDFFEQATTLDKCLAACQAYVVPRWLLERGLGLHRVKGDDVLAIVFTAGSTGPPRASC